MTQRIRLKAGGSRITIDVGRPIEAVNLPSSPGIFTWTGRDSTLVSSAEGGVVISDTDIVADVVLVGSDPGVHGLHVDHSPHPARFFGAVTKTAISDGDWNNSAIWSPSGVPDSDDIVRIPSRLSFDNTTNTKLTCNGLYVNEDGELTIDYSASNNTAEIVFADNPIDTVLDPYQWGHGLIGLGTVTIRGKAKTPWGRLSAEVSAAATTLTMASGPTGWAASDKLVLIDSRQLGIDLFNSAHSSYYTNAWFDELTVSSVASTTVSLSGSVTHDHGGAKDRVGTIDFYPVVLNLTRNVLIRSANYTGTRPHLVSHGRATIDVRYCEFRDTGRSKLAAWDNSNGVTPGTNQQGRYGGWHFHHTIGPLGLASDVPQFRYEGNACWNRFDTLVDDLPRWGITVHGSHYGLVKDNALFNWSGAGVVCEDGDETENVFDGNAVCGVFTAGTGENSRGTADIGHTGMAFWMRGVENRIVNNFASGVANGYGIIPYMTFTSPMYIPSSKGADPYSGVPADRTAVVPKERPILEFDNNEAGGRVPLGLTFWKVGSVDGFTANPTQEESVVLDCKFWHCSNVVWSNYMTSHITFDGLIARGDFTLLRNRGSGNVCFSQGDYVLGYFTVRNSNIQGFYMGWDVDFGEGTMLCEDTTWCNYMDVFFKVPFGAGSPANTIPPRDMQFHSTIHLDPLCDTFGDYGPQGTVWMRGSVFAYSANLVHENSFQLFDYNGGGIDYRVYYPEQAGDYLLPASTILNGLLIIDGCPSAGGGPVNDASPSATEFDGPSTLSASDDTYNGKWVLFINGPAQGAPRQVTDYIGATRTFQFSSGFPVSPNNGDTFVIDNRKTNTQALADHGVCHSNKITPGGTTTLPRITGDVEVL